MKQRHDLRIAREGRCCTVWDHSAAAPYIVAIFYGDQHRLGVTDAQMFVRAVQDAAVQAADEIGKLLAELPAQKQEQEQE